MITKLKIFMSGLLISAMLISAAPQPAKADVNNIVNAVIIDCAVAAAAACIETDGRYIFGKPKDYTVDFIDNFWNALNAIQINRTMNDLTGD
jgi:hypothetical protein